MHDHYGEDFEKLNGFHESNMNYSDFVDGFIDKNNKKAVADTTIDGNANATTRDICSLLNERGKPEDKLFVFNKIFYELKKKYGLKTAKDWLDTEWSGGFYLHDAHTASFSPCVPALYAVPQFSFPPCQGASEHHPADPLHIRRSAVPAPASVYF